jgi:hypothetical protein
MVHIDSYSINPGENKFIPQVANYLGLKVANYLLAFLILRVIMN